MPRRILSILVLLGLSSCVSPRSAIETQQRVLAKQWHDAAPESQLGPGEPMAWTEAVDRLFAGNMAIQRAAADRRMSERNLRQVYNRLLPLVSVRVGVTESVSDLEHRGIRNFLSEVDLFSYFDGVMSLNRDHYAAELGYLRALAVEELVRREKVAELYRSFVADQELRQTEQIVGKARTFLSLLWSSPSFAQPSANWEDLRERARTQREQWENSILELLQVSGRKITLRSETVPPFDFGRSLNLEGEPEQVGMLQRRLVAIELVGAEARLLGAKMAYWPDLSTYVSSGPLFTNSNGQSYWFSTDRLTVSAGIRVPVDLNGQIKNGVVEARQALEILQTEVAAKQRLLLRDCREKQQDLDVIARSLARVDRKTRAVEQLMVSAPPTELASLLQTWVQLHSTASDLRLKRAEATSFLLTLDETFWKTMGRDLAAPSSPPSRTHADGPHSTNEAGAH